MRILLPLLFSLFSFSLFARGQETGVRNQTNTATPFANSNVKCKRINVKCRSTRRTYKSGSDRDGQLLHLSFYILRFYIFSPATPSTPANAGQAVHLLPSTVPIAGAMFSTRADSLPATDSLFLSLQRYHDQQLQAQLAEFQVSERGKWLKYIPSLGVGYSLGTDAAGNLKNVLRPSISYNTNVIYRVRQDRELRRAKMESIRQSTTLQYANEKRQLELLLRRYHHAQTELEFMERLHQIDTELYEIATIQFTSAEMAPSIYLPKKKAFLQKQFELLQQRQQLAQLEAEIRLLAKKG